jgi:hypothetical protein
MHHFQPISVSISDGQVTVRVIQPGLEHRAARGAVPHQRRVVKPEGRRQNSGEVVPVVRKPNMLAAIGCLETRQSIAWSESDHAGGNRVCRIYTPLRPVKQSALISSSSPTFSVWPRLRDLGRVNVCTPATRTRAPLRAAAHASGRLCARGVLDSGVKVKGMAHPNIDSRREAVGKVLTGGIQIGSREAKVLGVLFGCSESAIVSDAKSWRTEPPEVSSRPRNRCLLQPSELTARNCSSNPCPSPSLANPQPKRSPAARMLEG